MTSKNINQIIRDLDRLNNENKIDYSIYKKLSCKIKNHEILYYDDEKERTYKYLEKLVECSCLSDSTFNLIKTFFKENEEEQKKDSEKIIHSIISKNREERRSNARLKNKKKAFWITFFTGIIGWTYCYYYGNEECKKISNHIFISQIAFTIAVVSIVTSILMLR